MTIATALSCPFKSVSRIQVHTSPQLRPQPAFKKQSLPVSPPIPSPGHPKRTQILVHDIRDCTSANSHSVAEASHTSEGDRAWSIRAYSSSSPLGSVNGRAWQELGSKHDHARGEMIALPALMIPVSSTNGPSCIFASWISRFFRKGRKQQGNSRSWD